MESSSAEQKFMTRLNEIIDANLHDEKFGVSELASELGMNRATLHRKVKAIVNQSVSSFIREARLKRAHQLLQQKDGTVSEIAYQVGFGSVPYFTRSFHKYFGYTPGDVLKGSYSIEVTGEREENIPLFKKFFQKKIRYILIPVLILLIVVIAYLLAGNHNKPVPKTIAVLPVETDSSMVEMESGIQIFPMEIIDRLNSFQNISVVPYFTSSIYNAANKSNYQIGKDLLVDYVIRGKATKLGDNIKIFFQFIEISNDKTIWNDNVSISANNSNSDNFFNIPEDFALNVEKALPKNFMHVEKDNLDKKLTDNEDALSLYNTAKANLNKFDIHLNDVWDAKRLLEKAIELDTTFSEAYSKLARIYQGNLRYTPDIYLAENYMDSAKLFYGRALIFDETNQEAISGLYKYYTEKGIDAKAKELEARISRKSIKNFLFYLNEFSKYSAQRDYYNQLNSFFNYIDSKPTDTEVPWWVCENVYVTLNEMGFPVQARNFADKKYLTRWKKNLLVNSPEAFYIYEFTGDYETGYHIAKQVVDTSSWIPPNESFFLVRYFERKGDFAEASRYLDILENVMGPWGQNWLEMLSDTSRLIYPFGYCYLKTGQQDKADYYFNRLIKKYSDEIRLKAYFARNYYCFLEISMVYSAMGDKEEAFKYLQEIGNMKACPFWFILELKNSPWFDNIRNEQEFKILLNEFENKFQKEHEQIKKLLISRGIEPT